MVGRKKSDGRLIKGTLSGYSLWAFERYCDAHAKDDGAAIRSIIETWLRLEEKSVLEGFGVSLELFRKARGENVAQFEKKPNGAAHKPRS
jgi:hypothetical protein